MSDAVPTPKGVVAVLTDKWGATVASASDFEQSSPGGFGLKEAQERRARGKLAMAMVNACCSSDVAEAFDPYDAEKMLRRLCDQRGMRVTFAPVGHDGGAAEPAPSGCADCKAKDDEIAALRGLVKHCWLHTNYRNCGYDKMTSEERDLFDRITTGGDA